MHEVNHERRSRRLSGVIKELDNLSLRLSAARYAGYGPSEPNIMDDLFINQIINVIQRENATNWDASGAALSGNAIRFGDLVLRSSFGPILINEFAAYDRTTRVTDANWGVWIIQKRSVAMSWPDANRSLPPQARSAHNNYSFEQLHNEALALSETGKYLTREDVVSDGVIDRVKIVPVHRPGCVVTLIDRVIGNGAVHSNMVAFEACSKTHLRMLDLLISGRPVYENNTPPAAVSRAVCV